MWAHLTTGKSCCRDKTLKILLSTSSYSLLTNQRTKTFAIMSYFEIIQFFQTSRKEYHTFIYGTIMHSFMISICLQDIVFLNCLLSASYEITHSIRQKDRYVHLRNPCLQYHKENEQDTIVSINYSFQRSSTVHVCSLTKGILKT